VRIWVKDRDRHDYNPARDVAPLKAVIRKGHKFDIETIGVVEVFRLGVLAEAMDRKDHVLWDWERRGVLPKPLYEVTFDTRCRRWYSAHQIVNVNRLTQIRWQGKKYLHKRNDFDQFLAEMRLCFYAPDLVVDEQGVLLI